MSRVSTKYFCCTLNNYESHELIFDPDLHSYLVYGREIGESGTPHLQIYVEMVKRSSYVAVKQSFGENTLHVEKRLGTSVQARDYCLKGEQTHEEWSSEGVLGTNFGINASFEEYGVISKSQQASCLNSEENLMLCANMIAEGSSIVEVATLYPSTYCRYYRCIDKLVSEIKRERAINVIKATFSETILRPWQSRLSVILEGSPCSRKIYWYFDAVGNCGKSYFASYITAKRNGEVAVFGNAKSADVAYSYKDQGIVIFDYMRSNLDYINYTVMEEFKNGRIFSPKYESQLKLFAVPHVVCFANEMPAMTKLSLDRWHIIKLEKVDEEIIESLYNVYESKFDIVE